MNESNCPTDCPNRMAEGSVQRVGLGIAAIALSLFVGAWVARGWFERKTPTVFEIGFAVACVYLALVDPKSAKSLSTKAVLKVLGDEGQQ